MTENSQRGLPLLGDLKRPMHVHSPAEIVACKSKRDACRIALMHSGLSQETVAARLGCTPGFLCLLLGGKRDWSDERQYRFERITGSLAPHQWDVQRRGLSMHADPVEVRKAQLRAEIEALERAA